MKTEKLLVAVLIPFPKISFEFNLSPMLERTVCQWVQKVDPIQGLGSGEMLLGHFRTPTLHWISFSWIRSSCSQETSGEGKTKIEKGLTKRFGGYVPIFRLFFPIFAGRQNTVISGRCFPLISGRRPESPS